MFRLHDVIVKALDMINKAEEVAISPKPTSDGNITYDGEWKDGMLHLRTLVAEIFAFLRIISTMFRLRDVIVKVLDMINKAEEVASSPQPTSPAGNLDDARMCIICQENPKSVLFMDCRHLCVCMDCGHLDVLVRCPLCRQIIRERIDVFM